MKTHKLSAALRDLANKIDAFESSNEMNDEQANQRMDLIWPEIEREIPEVIAMLETYLTP